MALCSATSTRGYPDLHHPLQYRKQEALWKQHCVKEHNNFCACGNFLSHFRWPSGGEGIGGRGGQNGEEEESTSTGEESIIGATGGGEEEDYIPDNVLLQ
uniref:ORF2 n=1 Tax=Torque teno Leptonychotes weddellii virus-1 TaxID=2012676 RepID=A0A1Z2RWT2_9VIRU|nr:ORF2 [Torque teno Leptonychotes weddellii virus 1]